MKAETPVRLRSALRQQVELIPGAIDDLIPKNHWVRLVWKHLEKLDLSCFYDHIEARMGRPGRDATDPRILLCLWIVAADEGITHARELAERCVRDSVYRWICGGVTVNRDLLAAFKSNRRKEFDELFTQNLAAVMKAGLVTLRAAAQDGVKMRASAGAASFRREPTLEECLRAAQEHTARLHDEFQPGDETLSRREAAQLRAAEEKLAAMERALAEMPAVLAAKEEQRNKSRAKLTEARVSSTDPEARVMKMADGGYRPAFNPQLATDVDSGLIIGVHLSNSGNDARELEPVIADILSRTQRLPLQYLIDGGYVSGDNIDALTDAGIEVFAPVRKPRTANYDPYEPQPQDSPQVAAWRKRMATHRGKHLYKQRAATAERVNAELRSRGLREQLTVRGIEKASSALLLAALAFNICRAVTLLG